MAVNLWPIRNQRERRVVLYVERDADWNRSRGASCYVTVCVERDSFVLPGWWVPLKVKTLEGEGEGFTLNCLKRTAFGFFFVTMRGGDLSLLIGSQLRALLLTQYGRVRVEGSHARPRRETMVDYADEYDVTVRCGYLEEEAPLPAKRKARRRLKPTGKLCTLINSELSTINPTL